MDPTLDENQGNQPQEKQKQGIVSRGINSFNRARTLSNPLGKIGSRVATQTALRGFSALLASQVGLPIAIALGAILLFTTIMIMVFGGAPGAPSSQTSVQAPPTETTETITPTPAAPESAL